MKENSIKVYGTGEELTWGEISSKLAKEIINRGVSQDQKDQLISDSECGITSEINVEVNGKFINFDIAKIDLNDSCEQLISGNPKKWYLLEVLELSGLFYETVSDKPFDLEKIGIRKEKYKVGGVPLESIFYSISYDGQENPEDFDFSQREFSSASYFVLSPKGEIFEIDINEEIDDEDCFETGNEEDVETGTLEILCDNASTAEKLIAELSTWGFYREINVEVITLPKSKVALIISGSKAILVRVDTVTNQVTIQALGVYSKKLLV